MYMAIHILVSSFHRMHIPFTHTSPPSTYSPHPHKSCPPPTGKESLPPTVQQYAIHIDPRTLHNTQLLASCYTDTLTPYLDGVHTLDTTVGGGGAGAAGGGEGGDVNTTPMPTTATTTTPTPTTKKETTPRPTIKTETTVGNTDAMGNTAATHDPPPHPLPTPSSPAYPLHTSASLSDAAKRLKLRCLQNLLTQAPSCRAMVFCRTQVDCVHVQGFLQQLGGDVEPNPYASVVMSVQGDRQQRAAALQVWVWVGGWVGWGVCGGVDGMLHVWFPVQYILTHSHSPVPTDSHSPTHTHSHSFTHTHTRSHSCTHIHTPSPRHSLVVMHVCWYAQM